MNPQQVAFRQLRSYADGVASDLPTVKTYLDAGVKDLSGKALVTSANLASINSALASAAVTGSSISTTASLVNLVYAYGRILVWANGALADVGTKPQAADYSAIGVVLTSLGTSEGLNLLNAIVGGKTRSGVDSVAELQALVGVTAKLMAVVAGKTPASPLSVADLQLAGLTGVTAKNLPVIVGSLAAQVDDGSSIGSLGSLQSLVNKAGAAQSVIEAYANNNGGNIASFPAPTQSQYADVGLTLSSAQTDFINSALRTATVVGTGVDSTAELAAMRTVIDTVTALTGNPASSAVVSKADLALIGVVVDLSLIHI
jgi:hypothetical protein